MAYHSRGTNCLLKDAASLTLSACGKKASLRPYGYRWDTAFVRFTEIAPQKRMHTGIRHDLTTFRPRAITPTVVDTSLPISSTITRRVRKYQEALTCNSYRGRALVFREHGPLQLQGDLRHVRGMVTKSTNYEQDEKHMNGSQTSESVYATIKALDDELDESRESNIENCVDKSSFDLTNVPGTDKGGGRIMAIVYTCKVCNTRSARKFTERAYRHGVVLVKCPGCQNMHLIADRLGYFDDKEVGGGGGDGDGWDVQKFIETLGEKVTRITDENVLEFTGGIVDEAVECDHKSRERGKGTD